MSLQAHFAAWLGALRSRPKLANKVYTAVRFSSGTTPVRENYVVAYPSTPWDLDDSRYSVEQSVDSSALYRYDFRAVATTADGCLVLADDALALIGSRLDVPGRSCTAVELVGGVEEGRVEFDAAVNLFYLDLTFQFWSFLA